MSRNEEESVQVLSYNEAAARAGIVRRTLERLISLGEGPATIEISKRRRGVLDRDLDAWLLKRRRPVPGEDQAA
jgi:predicted DNA-binding transcriptional regulator AlpA